jgi:hypothetical protein
MAAIQRIVSPLTKDVSYRAQVRVKGRSSESATFPNRKEAEAWAAAIETAIREGRHFPHAAAKRTSFDALAKDYAETVLVEFDEVQRAARTLQLNWWSKQFAGKSVAEITANAVSKAREVCAAETFTRGKPRKDKKTGEIIPPKEYRRSGTTVNRYIGTLSHLFSFAVKERRLIDRNPVGDIRRKKEPRGRTRFLSDEERAALLHACANSEWVPLHALVLLAITTGACRGELVSLKWADVDLKAGRANIHDTKNGEQRTLPPGRRQGAGSVTAAQTSVAVRTIRVDANRPYRDRCLRLSMRRVADSRTVLPRLGPRPQRPCQAARRRAQGGVPTAGADGHRERSWWALLKTPGSPRRTRTCDYTQLAYNDHRHAGGLRRIAGFRAKPRELPG